MRNVLVYASLVFLFLIAVVSTAYGSYGQYGEPTPSKAILIDKLVAKPSGEKGGGNSQDYVDNLAPADPRFAADQHVFFKLVVKNTSEIELTDVVVTDSVPDFLVPVAHPGNYDSDSREITFNAGDFAIDEEKTYILEMKFVGESDLPDDHSITCVVNEAKAEADDVSDDDTSQVCVEKQVENEETTSEITTIETIPSTGPEFMGLIVAAEITLLGAGLYIRKKV